MPKVAMRGIRSRRVFVNADKARKELERTLDNDVKPHFISEFDKIVSNWDHRPTFRARKRITQDEIRLYVFPATHKQLWQWNVEGTRPHPIRAKNAPTLRFKAGTYMPKTGPGGKWYGGPGRVAGGQWVSPFAVMHPGTEPRNWPEVIRKQEKRWFSRTMENAWRRGIRKLG
jgi:hypothetical protein